MMAIGLCGVLGSSGLPFLATLGFENAFSNSRKNQGTGTSLEDFMLNRPGGNATGVNVLATDLEGKRLELLGELVSASAPVAALINPKAEYAEQQAKDLQEGAHRISRQILILNASSEGEVELR
jgi:hypothetical protein